MRTFLFIMLLIGQFIFMGGCSSDDSEARDFADNHFYESVYRNVEFNVALSSVYGDSGSYAGSMDDWNQMDWSSKISYLPHQGFTHELPTQSERNANSSHDDQYYEMIGKYIRQFGFGWDDAYGDDPETPYFDGESSNSLHYMDLRADANKGCDDLLGF